MPFKIDLADMIPPQCRRLCRLVPSRLAFYFVTVRFTFTVAPATVTGCEAGLPFSLPVFNVYWPGGTFLITKLPSLSVTAKYGVGTTKIIPDISGCTLHSNGTSPISVNVNGFDKPWGQVPMLWASFLS